MMKTGDLPPIFPNVALGPAPLGQHWEILAEDHPLIKSLKNCKLFLTTDNIEQHCLQDNIGIERKLPVYNGLYSLKKCHKPFGQGFQPPAQ